MPKLLRSRAHLLPDRDRSRVVRGGGLATDGDVFIEGAEQDQIMTFV